MRRAFMVPEIVLAWGPGAAQNRPLPPQAEPRCKPRVPPPGCVARRPSAGTTAQRRRQPPDNKGELANSRPRPAKCTATVRPGRGGVQMKCPASPLQGETEVV